MRFTEIGQQLRAYRLESGLRAEEIAARLGVSRAALYRYEKGEVIKLDTIKRLAELLKISPLSLLGIGVDELRWLAPVRPGDVIYLEGVVTEVTPSKTRPQGTVKVKWTAFKQDCTAVYTFTPSAIVPRRPSSA